MISVRPEFREGEHFRINRKGKPKFRYTTLRTTRIMIDVPIDETISFRDRHGIEWMRLAPTACGKTQKTIREGYSWDGATCVPDCNLYLETLNHDTDCQFRFTEHFPFSKLQVDNAFLDLMKLGNRKVGIFYWRGVRMFGWMFRSQNGEWSKILTTYAMP
jgi:hypothetical protein